MPKIKHIVVFFLAFSFILIPATRATDNPSWLDSDREALNRAMSEMGVSKADSNLLVLTNAGYGGVENQSTEAFPDTAVEETGCTMGSQSLLLSDESTRETLR